MNSTPKISIIVPVYNVEQFLPCCIDNVLAQTFTDFELLLIDDGSTDTSSHICDNYAERDSRIRVFHKNNEGVSVARNIGLNFACGDYILFLDSDDYYCETGCLQQLYEAAEGYQLDLVRGEYKAVDENGIELSQKSLMNERLPKVGQTLESDEMLCSVLLGEYFVWLMLIKREVVSELCFPPKQVFLEDMLFLMHLFQKPLRCQYLPLQFYAYRKIRSSASNVHNIQNMVDAFSMCDFYAQIAEKAQSDKMMKYCEYRSVMMYYWTLDSTAEYYNREQRKEIFERTYLGELRKRTLKRIFQWRIYNKYTIFILLNQHLAISVCNAKRGLVRCLINFKNGIYSRYSHTW